MKTTGQGFVEVKGLLSSDLLEAGLKCLVRRGIWYLVKPSFVLISTQLNGERKDQSTIYWMKVIPSQ